MNNYYFTFGTSNQYPFYRGYIIVQADDRNFAIDKFRSYYPDVNEGVVNCAFIYTEEEWMRLKNTDRTCHEVISDYNLPINKFIKEISKALVDSSPMNLTFPVRENEVIKIEQNTDKNYRVSWIRHDNNADVCLANYTTGNNEMIMLHFVTDIKSRIHNRRIEELWEELEDVLFIEEKDFYKDDREYADDITLVLAEDWNIFPAGTDRESIWNWFNHEYPNGLENLIESSIDDRELE